MRKLSPLFLSVALLSSLSMLSGSFSANAAEAESAAATTAAADSSSSPAPSIAHLERIDPVFRPYAPNMQGDYSSAEAVVKANEKFAPAEKFQNSVPELIEVKNAQDGTSIEVSIYKPQKCSENTPKCPVFAYEPQYNQNGSGSADEKDHPLILFSHAGGFLLRANYYLSDTYQMISNTLQAVVAVPRYRLSFEAPFPAPVIDNYSALSYLIEHAKEYNINQDQVILMGNSAGGGLSAALALYNRDHKNYPIKAQALIYPMVDYHTGNIDAPKPSEYLGQIAWSADDNAYAWEAYGDATAIATISGHTLPDEHGFSNDMTMRVAIPPHLQKLKNFHEQHRSSSALKGEPDYFGYYSPAMAKDLRALPPTFINVGDSDLFAPESLKFASRLIESGNTVELHLVPGTYHLYEFLDPNATASKQYYNRLFYFLDQRLLAPAGQIWPESTSTAQTK